MNASTRKPLGIGLLTMAGLFFAYAIVRVALNEPTHLERLFLAALMLSSAGTLLFALARPATALFIAGGGFFALKLISALKRRYLESPLMPSDFIYFANTSLLETLKHYPHLLLLGAGIGVSASLVLVLCWRLERPLFNRMPQGVAAALRSAGVVLCTLAWWVFLLPQGPFATVYNKGLWNKLSDNAYLTNFFISFRDTRIKLPATLADPILEQEWHTSTPGPMPAAAPEPPPDIVQVLEESTFDPASLTNCNIQQCRLDMFQPDALTRSHGPLRTHTFGGGTWVSEFAVLTGLPQDIFGPAGMYAPYVLAPRMHDSLPKQLHKLGYLTVAIYPVGGGFINARNAYQAYGFDQFYDVNDLDITSWHASDSQIFATAKHVYDKVKKPGQPVFLMILTMEQHGPHDSTALSSLPPPFNQGLLPNLPPSLALNLSTYLARVHDSDVGMAQLEKDFLHRNEPTILLHFGDHLPSFSGLIRDMPRSIPAGTEAYKNNLTYYMLKSNFATGVLPNYPALDIAYLPGLLLQAAGLPEDAYFHALHELRNRCNGLYVDCPDKRSLESYYNWIFNKLEVLDTDGAERSIDATAGSQSISDLLSASPDAVCSASHAEPSSVTVSWKIPKDANGPVQIWIRNPGADSQPILWAEKGEDGSAETGRWVLPGTRFTLTDASGKRTFATISVQPGKCQE